MLRLIKLYTYYFFFAMSNIYFFLSALEIINVFLYLLNMSFFQNYIAYERRKWMRFTGEPMRKHKWKSEFDTRNETNEYFCHLLDEVCTVILAVEMLQHLALVQIVLFFRKLNRVLAVVLVLTKCDSKDKILTVKMFSVPKRVMIKILRYNPCSNSSFFGDRIWSSRANMVSETEYGLQDQIWPPF